MAKRQIKQTLLLGALTSSFGIFVSKILGLLYYSPLSELAGEANMSFYSIAYTYYDFLLKISGAGIPFAIASLVAKYCTKEDYKTAFLAKKLGQSIVLLMSLFAAFIFTLLINPLTRQTMGQMASVDDIRHLKNLLYILIIAVIIVPYLSSLRGYYQGLKRLDLYASSQVLEQFVRVSFILIAGYICVAILKIESIYVIYMAILAASIAAISSIIFIKTHTKEEDIRVKELIDNQNSDAISKKELFKEIITISIPYILISFFGSASTLINTTFFLDYATKIGDNIENAKLSLGILQANCNKLLAIPQVLTLGFSSGLVPYLTESLEKKDYETLSKQMKQIFETVLFFLLPIVFMFYFFSSDIYFILYGNKNLELSSALFKTSCLIAFSDTLAPILSSCMITLKLKKEAIITLIISFFVKYFTFFKAIDHFGAKGMVYSTFYCTMTCIILYIIILKKKFGFKLTTLFTSGYRILFSAVTVGFVFGYIRKLLPIGYDNRMFNLILMGCFGLIYLVTYLFVTKMFKLPQEILDTDDVSISSLIKRIKK